MPTLFFGLKQHEEGLAMPEISQALWDRAESILGAMGIELVGIEVLGGRRNRILRVTIDHPDGVSLDLCGEVSEVLGSLFEEDDPIPGSYVLEVSSPGVERPLRSRREWERSRGDLVSIKLTDGEGVVCGRIDDVLVDSIVLLMDESGHMEVPFSKIKSARTVFEWNGN